MLRSIFIALLLFTLPISSNAVLQQAPVTAYTGLNFNINGLTVAGFPSDCTSLVLDVTGAIGTSGRFAIYGSLDCYVINISFSTLGNGYISNVGTLEITSV